MSFAWKVRNADVAVVPNLRAEKTSGGVILPSTGEPPLVGKVLGVGPEVKDLRPGSTVIFAKWSGTEVEVEHEGRRVVMIDQKSIKLVLEE